MIAIAILLVVTPVVVSEAPRERARWHFAAALEYDAQGQPAAAMAALEKAIALDSHQPDYYLARARLFYFQKELARALEEMRRAGEVAAHDRIVETLYRRADFFQRLGLWNRALSDWEQLETLHFKGYPSPFSNANVLNGAAYARALANQQLEKALEDVNEALRREPSSAAFLDTRGYIFYRKGEWKNALADLNAAVTSFRETWREQQQRITEESPNRIATDGLEETRRALDRSLAAILYHRMLVYNELDDTAAAKDADEIKQLGFDPETDRLY